MMRLVFNTYDVLYVTDEALSAGSSDFLTEASGMSVDASGGGYQMIGPNPWLLDYWFGELYSQQLAQL